MLKIKKYSPNNTYMLGNGESGHEAVVKYFPGVENFTHIVETDEGEEIAYAIELFSATKSRLGVDPSLPEEEAIAEIERIRNLPPPEPIPDTTQVRIADALQDLVVLSMPDDM